MSLNWHVWAIVLACAKIHVLYSISTYFFYFTQQFFKNIHQIIYSTFYFIWIIIFHYLFIIIFRERENLMRQEVRKKKVEIMIYKVRAFASTRAKIYVYFNIRIYFFSNLHTHFLKQSTLNYLFYTTFFLYNFFLIIFNCFSFFTYNNHHPLSSFIFKICKKIINK